jgi:integrase
VPRLQLTDLVLRKVRAEKGRKELWDTQIDGFGVRVSESGLKAYFVVYRDLGGIKRRQGLGTYPDTSLADARDAAYQVKRAIEKGEKPALVAEAEQKETERKAAVRASKSFVDAVDDYLQIYCAEHNRPSTQDEKRWILRNTCGGRWKDKAIGEIGKQEVVKLLDEYMKAGKGSGANHILSRLRTFFAWCVERELVTTNPCDKLRKPARVKTRERVLTADELARIWHASAIADYPYGAIMRLLLLTGQRRGEVVGLRWSEIGDESRLWTIPKERTKNGREHALPVSDLVLSIIEELPMLNDALVFPAKGKTETTFSGFSKCKAELDRLSGVKDWTLHDLRRTAATGMAKLGTAPHVVEAILNHLSGTFAGVAGIYNRHDYESEMRVALDQWSRHVASRPVPADLADTLRAETA